MATLHTDTITNVLQIVSDLRGETTTNTNAIRVRAVSRSERDFARRYNWDFFHLKGQNQVGSGVADYTIGSATYPYRERGVTEVFVSTDGSTTEDKRYSIVDFHRFKNIYNNNTSANIVYEWFDAANDLWKLHINPAPSASETITYAHFWIPPKKTSATDNVHCPNMRILALLALGDIYAGEDEDDKAIDAKNEAEQLINEALGLSNSSNVNQLRTFGSITNSITSRGIGSY